MLNRYDWPPKPWRYLLLAGLSAVMVGAWLLQSLSQLYRSYETGVIRMIGGRGAPVRDVSLHHNPEEFAYAFWAT